MEFTYADCVKLMPEWNGLALGIRELKGGITNQLYRVTEEATVFFGGRRSHLYC